MISPRWFAVVVLALSVRLAPGAEADPVVFGKETLPPLPNGAFTVVVVPDTQSYRGRGCKATPHSTDPVTNENLAAQVAWIVKHRDDQNIVFVSHVGDIVDRNTGEQWAVAKEQLDKLRGIVPFGLTVGNHDMTSKGDARLFQRHFPASSFREYPWYLGCYEHDRADQNVSANNVNSAQTFTAGGRRFIVLHLECNAPDDVLAWADDLMRKNSDKHVLVTTHMDLGIVEHPKSSEGYIRDPKGRMRWVKIHGARGNNGEQLWEKLFRKHANLKLICCGDQSRVTALRLTTVGDAGNPVPSLLSDYQSRPVLRLMRFGPEENRVHVLTYDVEQSVLVERTKYVADVNQHQFTLDYSPGAASSR